MLVFETGHELKRGKRGRRHCGCCVCLSSDALLNFELEQVGINPPLKSTESMCEHKILNRAHRARHHPSQYFCMVHMASQSSPARTCARHHEFDETLCHEADTLIAVRKWTAKGSNARRDGKIDTVKRNVLVEDVINAASTVWI